MSELKTDFSRVMELFTSLGFKIEPVPTIYRSPKPREIFLEIEDDKTSLHFGDGITPNFRAGYGGFGFCLCFSKDGKFLGHGAFE